MVCIQIPAILLTRANVEKGKFLLVLFSSGKIRESRRALPWLRGQSRQNSRAQEDAIVSDEFIRISSRLVGNDRHSRVSCSLVASLVSSAYGEEERIIASSYIPLVRL